MSGNKPAQNPTKPINSGVQLNTGKFSSVVVFNLASPGDYNITYRHVEQEQISSYSPPPQTGGTWREWPAPHYCVPKALTNRGNGPYNLP